MLAMLFRNFILSRKNMYLGAAFVILYAFILNSASLVIAGSMLVGLYLFSVTLFAFEERAHSLSMNKSLPISNSIIIGAYYIASTIYSFALLLLSLAVIYGVIYFDIKQLIMPTVREVGTYMLLYAVIISVQIPIIIKFGITKLRWINMFILMVGFMLVGALGNLDFSGFRLDGISSVLVSLGATILLIVTSHLVSVRIYERKECD